MTLNTFSALIAQGAPQGGPGDFLRMMGPIMIAMAAFMIISSQMNKKKVKQHQALVDNLKPGDKILTTGGIIGTVVSVKEKSVSLRSADSKFEVIKSAVSEVTERGSSESKES
jgi:preprotein translocase subunit YajC